MLARRIRGALTLGTGLLVLAAAACGGGSDVTGGGSNGTAANLAIVSGNGQVGQIGTALQTPLVVKVTTSSGSTLSGATVSFAVTSGAASVSPSSTTTDAGGLAKTTVTLGSAAGDVTITATVAGTGLTAAFTVTAGTSTQTTACSSGAAQSVPVGGVVALANGSGICLSGGSTGSEFALVVFHGNPDSSAVAALTVRSSGGATAVNTSNVIPSFPSFNATPTSAQSIGRLRNNAMQRAFDTRLRKIAQRELAPKVLAGHPKITRSASFTVVPANPAVGTLVSFNANGEEACSNPINVTARVAAVGSSNIVLADTANAKPTFSDAEYAAFATEFDTLINAVDVQNFGQPSDIDNNGKVLILFTKEVNKLTPRGSDGVVGGFTFERDLFPRTDTPTLEGCAGSNLAEMFYVLAPDTLAVFGDKRKKDDVLSQTPGTLAHEYQHLINAGRRLYVNNFQGDFEDVWLNEGLSHIAEELLYYKKAGQAPRKNIDAAQIRSSQVALDAFNNEQIANTARYEIFIGKPNATSVYAGNDSLETRGATWELLRYLADHRASTSNDGDTWLQLVNTETHGQANLAHVFGADYMTQIRNWATSVFSDDVPGVTDARYLQPSWNYRDIFPNLKNSAGTPLGRYPLAVVPVSDASPATLSVDAGGAAYVRFFVPAGATSSIDWSSGGLPVSSLVQFTVVRSK
jgi:hypothetical protein